MAGLGVGEVSGIVALAAFAIKESFGFVRPFRKLRGQLSEDDWRRIQQVMSAELKVTETKLLQLEQDKERQTSLLEELVVEQRQFNTMFLRYISRQEGIEEGRRDRQN